MAGRVRLGIAVGLGLGVGLCLGGLSLSGLSWRTRGQPCEAPGTAECAAELASFAQVARLLSLAGVGLLLVGAGTLVFTRRAARPELPEENA